MKTQRSSVTDLTALKYLALAVVGAALPTLYIGLKLLPLNEGWKILALFLVLCGGFSISLALSIARLYQLHLAGEKPKQPNKPNL